MSLKEKATAFKGLVTLFVGVLLATLVFIGCSHSKNEKGTQGVKNSEVGVWKILSTKQIQGEKEETVIYPQTLPDKKSMLQPYICLSEGKIYGANEITNSSEADKNGMFQEELWDVAYTYANNAITIGQQLIPFVVTGNTATMTMSDSEDGTMIATLQRVSSPTVAEIKAAKKK